MQNMQASLCLLIFVVPALFLGGCGGGGGGGGSGTTKSPGSTSTTTSTKSGVTTTTVTTTMKDSTTKTISVPAYNKLQMSSGIVAQISTGDVSNVQVTLDKSMVDDLKAEVNNGLLHVWLDKPLPVGKPNPIAEIKVKDPLDGVTAYGGSKVTVLNRIIASVSCSGQGSTVTVHNLGNPDSAITIDADSGGAVSLDGGLASTVQINANNGAQLNLGTFEVLKANVVLKAKSSLSGMSTQDMQLSLDGASVATTEVDMRLSGSCTGGSKATITPKGLAVKQQWTDCAASSTSSLRATV